jgi:hypothetical protein
MQLVNDVIAGVNGKFRAGTQRFSRFSGFLGFSRPGFSSRFLRFGRLSGVRTAGEGTHTTLLVSPGSG